MATRFTKPVRLRQVSAQATGNTMHRIVPSPDWCAEETGSPLASGETMFSTELAVVSPTLLDVDDVVPAPQPSTAVEIAAAPEGPRGMPLPAFVFLAFLVIGFGAGFAIGLFARR